MSTRRKAGASEHRNRNLAIHALPLHFVVILLPEYNVYKQNRIILGRKDV